MRFTYRLSTLLIAMTLISVAIALAVWGGLQGVICFAAFLALVVILAAPGPVSWPERVLIVLSGVGAALVAWAVLQGQYGDQSLGFSWYTGRLPEIGGWGAGIFAGAWRASRAFARGKESR